jgi:hypothetical protein
MLASRPNGEYLPNLVTLLAAHKNTSSASILFLREVAARVARFFLIKHSKNGKNIPNNHEISQMATKYTK